MAYVPPFIYDEVDPDRLKMIEERLAKETEFDRAENTRRCIQMIQAQNVPGYDLERFCSNLPASAKRLEKNLAPPEKKGYASDADSLKRGAM